MKVVIVTGAAGLVGSACVEFFAQRSYIVVGIDNDMRQVFFGSEASTRWNRQRLSELYPKYYRHVEADIRDRSTIENLFREYSSDIDLIIHTAAQPSHDWASRDPHMDFSINANGTLVLLEAMRIHAPKATFILTSTNKVYGDTPNQLPLIEQATRYDLEPQHRYYGGVSEDMPIDQSTHSLFGASKLAADVLTQEYGRYFGLKTGVFRGGCLTGPCHSGTKLHGFLSYLMACCIKGTEYTIYGYKGKQVRDNIHSSDLVQAFFEFYQHPRCGEVYNIGGGRENSCSVLEAVQLCEQVTGKLLQTQYCAQNRQGDHIWYISDLSKFKAHYPNWRISRSLTDTIRDLYIGQTSRMAA